MKGLADKGEREEKRRNEGQKGLGDMNPLTHITITLAVITRKNTSRPAAALGAGGLLTVITQKNTCRPIKHNNAKITFKAQELQLALLINVCILYYYPP